MWSGGNNTPRMGYDLIRAGSPPHLVRGGSLPRKVAVPVCVQRHQRRSAVPLLREGFRNSFLFFRFSPQRRGPRACLSAWPRRTRNGLPMEVAALVCVVLMLGGGVPGLVAITSFQSASVPAEGLLGEGRLVVLMAEQWKARPLSRTAERLPICGARGVRGRAQIGWGE
jgi:hypothetical protein